jgi:hypothetical protein
MGKLLQRLSDPAKSGIYRAPTAGVILEAAKGSALRVARVDLAGVAGKEALLERIALALAFPKWFGGNWDALEDCLSDLSWLKAEGHVLVLEEAGQVPADDADVLLDILSSVTAYWAERGRPFFAVFVGGEAPLPELYRARR